MSTTVSTSLTTGFITDATPQQAFDAINDVRGWWGGEIEGPTDVLGEEFTYSYPGMHRSAHRVVELVPGERVAGSRPTPG